MDKEFDDQEFEDILIENVECFEEEKEEPRDPFDDLYNSAFDKKQWRPNKPLKNLNAQYISEEELDHILIE